MKSTGNTSDNILKKMGSVAIALALICNALVLIKDDPAQSEDALKNAEPAYVIEETVDEMPSPVDIIIEDEEDKKKQKQSISVKSIVSYVLGSLASFAVSLLGKLLTPIGAKILGWVIFAAAVFLAIVLALKKAFPDTPIKEILKPKNIAGISCSVLGVIALVEALKYWFKKYQAAFSVLAIGLGAVIAAVTCRKKKALPAEE